MMMTAMSVAAIIFHLHTVCRITVVQLSAGMEGIAAGNHSPLKTMVGSIHIAGGAAGHAASGSQYQYGHYQKDSFFHVILPFFLRHFYLFPEAYSPILISITSLIGCINEVSY